MTTAPDTPYAVVDEATMQRNIRRLRDRLAPHAVTLRPHVKTTKSTEIAAHLFPDGPGPITVSTLAEAEVFAAAGYTDILYAVGIAPHKLARVVSLQAQGVTVTVLLDSIEQARAVHEAAERAGHAVPALVEIDCDGHRGGIEPGDPALPEIARVLDVTGSLAGVLAHAGESYFAGTPEAMLAAARNERDCTVAAADALRRAGFACPVVSIGSTPTAHAYDDLTGITEVRAGNYVFFDLVMAGIGVCTVDDLALGVVVTVIGHQPGKGWIITDGGWMATSRDRGTANQAVDQGYGLVTTLDGTLIPDLVMSGASQEHGTLSLREGSARPLPELPVGTRVRILPNHACATAAQFDCYHVHRTDGTTAIWNRVRGW
ncbi:alanine racemase [Jiangella gansuensis]|uniref:alanine racemase n=1 Tax=Jiangella gansuensis TaxID=281473 RepID=UPI0004BC1EB4|nr:alanine racemase [Jiangella gansuensis]